MNRAEVWKKVHDKRMSQTDAAKLLGISRQRASQLYAKWKKKNVMEVPIVSGMQQPTGPDPLDDVFGNPPIPAEPLPHALPKSVAEVLAPAAPMDTVPEAGGVASAPERIPTRTESSASEVDPEDASAGRELITYARKLLAEAVAKWAGAKKDDPEFQTLAKENEFLRVALKRNSDKAAPLGWLTSGWKGLIIGAALEGLRIFLLTPKSQTVPEQVTEAIVTPETERPAATPDGDNPHATGEPEEPPQEKRPTLAEKIAAQSHMRKL